MPHTKKISIAILAGGRSRRMGTDKAMLSADGKPMLERMAQAAQETRRPVMVVGRPRPDSWPLSGITFMTDPTPDLGPIGGLQAALRHARGPVMLLACDMPRLTSTAINWLLRTAEERTLEHGLIVRNGDQLEPLFSVYMPSLDALIEERIAQQKLSLVGLFAAKRFAYIDAPADTRPVLVNVNTMDEWASLQI